MRGETRGKKNEGETLRVRSSAGNFLYPGLSHPFPGGRFVSLCLIAYSYGCLFVIGVVICSYGLAVYTFFSVDLCVRLFCFRMWGRIVAW